MSDILPLLVFPLVVLLVIWSLVWKGWALWHAARRGDRNWFIVLLLVNTVGLLEMFYLFSWRHTHPISDTH